ncbi:cysteine desulfurase [Nanoarchaeota archaeon]
MINYRKDFPILKRKFDGKQIVYLDNAATTQKPNIVIDAVGDFYKKYNANIHRGLFQLSEEATLMYEKAHENVSKFINSKFEEVVFTKNSTESLNLLAYSIGLNLKKEDEVVLTRMEHHSNLVPWQQLAKKVGFEVKYIEMNEDGSLDMESAEKLISKKTKVVSVVHMSNVLGTINDVKEISKIAHNKGSMMIVDGAQSVPHFKVDVKNLDCDFLVFSGHKMCGPTGIGGLYGKEEFLEKMNPFLYGGEMIRDVDYEKTRFNDLPWKFEAGTSNIAGGMGFSSAIDYLRKVGLDNIFDHEKGLLKYGTKRLTAIEGLKIIGNAKEKGGIISFDFEGVPPHDMATILDSEGVCVRAGHHCAIPLMKHLGINGTTRASFYLYNTKEEIDKLVLGIEKAKKIFKV